MPGVIKGNPESRTYDDVRFTTTRRGLLQRFPKDPEERTMLIGNWILMMRFDHAIIFDHMWRVIEVEFPHEVERAKARIAEIDKSLKPDPFL